MPYKARLVFSLAVLLIFAVAILQLSNPDDSNAAPASVRDLALPHQVYLPIVFNSNSVIPPTPTPSANPSPTPLPSPVLYRVNAPNFHKGQVAYDSTAIFWLGRVNPLESYADVRVGYNNQELYVALNVIDRRLWYNPNPSTSPLTDWDSSSLYLNLDGNNGTAPGTHAYRFDGQLNWWEPRTNYQAAYQGNGSGWAQSATSFSTTTGWRGDAPNDNTDDNGWDIAYEIPFASLGLAGPPTEGTKWGLSVALHNRDYTEFPPSPDQTWPPNLITDNSSTWGQLAFGLPQYIAPHATNQTTVSIRQGLNGAVVPDAGVGGTMDNLCGSSYGGWSGWGNTSYADAPRFNIQNQADVADWMCFSKYYVVFPLNEIPPGKVVVSATVTLHEFGSSGQQATAYPSLIQVMTVNEDWTGSALTWNNAPLARENVSRALVNPVTTFPGWPGVPWQWDVSGAVAEAYSSGQSLRLVLYEADSAMHSGKYFTGSNEPDWNAAARPNLDVVWGDP